MTSLQEKIIESLLEHKLITQKQLKIALKKQKDEGGNLAHILVAQGVLSDTDMLAFLSREFNIPPINLAKYKIDPKVARIIPERLSRQWGLIPISKIGTAVTVAVSDPFNILMVDDIRSICNCDVETVLATEQAITQAIERCYELSKEESISELFDERNEGGGIIEVNETVQEIDIEGAIRESQTPPIMKIVDLILIEALRKRSSDIHLEPEEHDVRVRYRIDGRLIEAMRLPKDKQDAVIARIKVMAGVDITESRLPQDGRFQVRFEDREIDFRVSILPVSFGGKIVLRALDAANLSVGLDKLGFLPETLQEFRNAIYAPFGMVLVTGPTGSGKSTTLYSILNLLNTPQRHIITIEDPVEYELEGVSQMQVHPEIDVTFANGLRSILRQTPDIILVGEIRDFETADIAVKASLTGHLLLSTLHTNDAPGAITRLQDMGVEPYLVTSSLVMVAAQRLMRKVCPHCKTSVSPPLSLLKDECINEAALTQAKLFVGKGCNRCFHTGFLGRMGTLETLTMNEELRAMIINSASSDNIREYMRQNNIPGLRQNAIKKFLMGLTSIDEVLRVTAEE